MSNNEPGDDDELNALFEQLSGLSGPSNKKKRNRVNQQIRELLEKKRPGADSSSSSTAAEANNRENNGTNNATTAAAPEAAFVRSARNSPSSSIVLDAKSLPPFRPTRAMVETVNVAPTPALTWAFVVNVPPLLRPVFLGMTGSSGGLVGAHTPPAAQWNFSMFHLTHHYQESYRKFIIEDDNQTERILLQITALRACPDSQGIMKELPREDYACVLGQREKLGAVPIFFVRYLYTSISEWRAHKPAEEQFMEGHLMKIRAASVDEIQFGYRQLRRGEAFVAQKGTNGTTTFHRSVIYPAAMQELETTQSHAKAEFLCANCNISLPVGKRQSCARCKVTFYCSRNCQRQHWPGHKQFCTSVEPSSDCSNNANTDPPANRPSFRFLVSAENSDMPYAVNYSFVTGSLTTAGMPKDARKSLGAHKMPTPRNAHGDSEFIVKVQPPVDAFRAYWMVYDGPTRSFQGSVPPDTDGLVDCYQKIRRDGISSIHPILGIRGYKAFCMAKWEGPHVRVYFDRFVPQQPW